MYRIKHFPILILIAVTCIIIAFDGNAATYYVDNQSSGNGSGTSMANAWKSFSAIAWAQINPGDTIQISGGSTSKTYREKLVVKASGSASSPITITRSTDSSHSGQVIVDGEYSRGSGIEIQYQSYITVRGLTVRHSIDSGTKGEIYLRQSTGTIIEDCTIEVERAHGGVHLNGYPGGGSGNIRCIIRNNRITTPAKSCSGQTDGIYSQLNTECVYEKNIIIIRNTNEVQHCDAVQSYKDNNITLRSNYIEQDNPKGANSQGLFISTSYGPTNVYNNICIGMHTTSSLLKSIAPSGGKISFYNNIVFGGKSNLIQTEDPYTKLINNIIVSSDAYTLVQFKKGVAPGNYSNIDNNIYYTPTSNMVVYDLNKSLNLSQWQALGADLHGLTGNPDLDRENLLYPRAESLVGGAGRNLSGLGFITDDYRGHPRPSVSAWSIGAYEVTTQSPQETLPKVEGLKVIEP